MPFEKKEKRFLNLKVIQRCLVSFGIESFKLKVSNWKFRLKVNERNLITWGWKRSELFGCCLDYIWIGPGTICSPFSFSGAAWRSKIWQNSKTVQCEVRTNDALSFGFHKIAVAHKDSAEILRSQASVESFESKWFRISKFRFGQFAGERQSS